MGTEETQTQEGSSIESATQGAQTNPETRSAAIAAVEALRAGGGEGGDADGKKAASIETEDDIRKPDPKDSQTVEVDADDTGAESGDASQTVTVASDPESGVELTKDQQVALRVRKQAQRYRADARAESEKAKQEREAAEAERKKLDAERAEIEAERQRLDALKKRAKEDPDSFYRDEVGRTFDDVVKDKIEAGKPDARLTSLERENAALRKRLDALDEREERSKKEAEERKKQEETEAQEREKRRKLDEYGAEYGRTVNADPKKYPKLNALRGKSERHFINHSATTFQLFQEEHGREPSALELAVNSERLFDFLNGQATTEEETDTTDESVVSTSPTAKPRARRPGGRGGAVVDLTKLDEEGRRKLAIREVTRVRATGKD